MEWDTPPDPALEPVADAAAPFLPVLFDLLERGRPNRAIHVVRQVWQRATTNRRRAVIAAAGFVAGLLAWPFHYRIGADCRIAPAVKQVVAAPFDSQLRKSFVRPGDTVELNQPLGELDNRDLKLKEAELIDLLEFLTQKGKYVPLPLDKVATIVSTQGMFYRKDADL